MQEAICIRSIKHMYARHHFPKASSFTHAIRPLIYLFTSSHTHAGRPSYTPSPALCEPLQQAEELHWPALPVAALHVLVLRTKAIHLLRISNTAEALASATECLAFCPDLQQAANLPARAHASCVC